MPDPGEYVAALPSDGLSIRSPPHVPQFIADPTEEPMQMELPEINNRNKPCQVGLWSLPVSYNQPNNAPPPPASLQVFSIYELLQNIFSQGAFHVDDGKPISMGHARAGSIAIHRSRQVCRYWNSLILKSKPLLQRMLVIQTPSHLQILNPIMMSPSTNSSDIQGQFTGAIAMITLAELEERINLTNPTRYFDGLMRNEASWRKMKLIMGGKLHENYQVVLNVVLYSLGDLPDFIQFHLDFDNIDGGPTADDLIDVLIEIAELEYMYGKYHSKQSLILMLRQTCHVTHGKLGPKRAQTWVSILYGTSTYKELQMLSPQITTRKIPCLRHEKQQLPNFKRPESFHLAVCLDLMLQCTNIFTE